MTARMRRLALVAALPAVTFATACDRSPTDGGDHHQLGTVVILDRSTVPNTPIATWNHASGWDTAELITISHSAEDHRTRVSLGVQMLTRGGDEIALSEGGEYSARYGVVSDPAGVVDMNVGANLFHGDHVHIYGHNDTRTTGSASILFALWHDNHSDGDTSPINITFTD